jgi:hypothetical protein
MPDESAIRERINSHINASPRGEAAKLAEAAGLSPATVSLFLSGTYWGRNDMVAARLTEVLSSKLIAEGVLAGRLRQNIQDSRIRKFRYQLLQGCLTI